MARQPNEFEWSGLLPVRPRPRLDESLLSWATRLAVGNGLEVETFLELLCQHADAGRRPSGHLDMERREALIGALARMGGVTPEIVGGMAMRPLARHIPAGHLLTSLARWSPEDVRHPRGVQDRYLQTYCPDCLAEGFYLRRQWNLAFACVCPVHRRQLLEHCPHCGGDLDFTDAGHHLWRRDQAPGTLPCRRCHFELTGASRHPDGLPIGEEFLSFLNALLLVAGPATPGRLSPRRRKALLAALLKLILMLQNMRASRFPNDLRRERRRELRRAVYRGRALKGLELPDFKSEWGETPYKERHVEVRHVLLQMAGWLLLDRRKRARWRSIQDGEHWDGLWGDNENRLKALADMVNLPTTERRN